MEIVSQVLVEILISLGLVNEYPWSNGANCIKYWSELQSY